jgi:hypothetical protein
MSEKQDTAMYWDQQLSGIDFSVLPNAPSNDKPVRQAKPKQNLLILALLSELIQQIKLQPRAVETAMVIFTLPNGGTRVVYPGNYSRDELMVLAESAEYFSHLIHNGEEGYEQDVRD